MKHGSCVFASMLLVTAMVTPAASEPDPRDIFGVYLSDRAETPCGRSANFGRNARCPVKEIAIAAKASVDDARDDPGLQCEPARLVRLFTWFPRPVEIIPGDNEIIFRYEHFGVVRTVHLDDHPTPPATWKSLHGFSRGHWEGDTLVVETTNLLGNLFVIPTSDETRTVERYRWNDDRTRLLLDVEVIDPVYYDAPFALRRAEFTPDPDNYIAPWVCEAQTDALFYGDIDAFFDDQDE